jgi:hypothetical protein
MEITKNKNRLSYRFLNPFTVGYGFGVWEGGEQKSGHLLYKKGGPVFAICPSKQKIKKNHHCILE